MFMARYLSPLNDIPFRRVFGEHPDLLISFLNALMPLEEDRRIERVEYLTAEQVPNNPAKRNSALDVRCTDNFGRQFIVEMQMFWKNHFSCRLSFDGSKAYAHRLNQHWEYLSQPVYGLSILNDVFDTRTDEFYHHYRIVSDRDTGEVIEGLEFVLVELPKFTLERWVERRKAALWLLFIKETNENKFTVSDELKEDSDTRCALEMCEIGTFTDGEMIAYDRCLDAMRVENSLIFDAWSIGYAKGKAKAKAELKAHEEVLIDVVLSCSRNGFSMEQIQTATGFSCERIMEILRSDGEE
jgi:predicted transposase/invertase (TIGR01784 family)